MTTPRHPEIVVSGQLDPATPPIHLREFLRYGRLLGLPPVITPSTSDIGPLAGITSADDYLGREHFTGFNPFAPVKLMRGREWGKLFVDVVTSGENGGRPLQSCVGLIVEDRSNVGLPPLRDDSQATYGSRYAARKAIQVGSLIEGIGAFSRLKYGSDIVLLLMAETAERTLAQRA